MNSHEILACIDHCPPAVRYAFSGIYDIGQGAQFYHSTRFPSCFVVYEPWNASVGHWVAGIVMSHSQCEIFNSLGGITQSLKTWLIRRKPTGMRLQWNIICVQPRTSGLCGLYCIFYLIHRLHKRMSFQSLFTEAFQPAPTAQNDAAVLELEQRLQNI